MLSNTNNAHTLPVVSTKKRPGVQKGQKRGRYRQPTRHLRRPQYRLDALANDIKNGAHVLDIVSKYTKLWGVTERTVYHYLTKIQLAWAALPPDNVIAQAKQALIKNLKQALNDAMALQDFELAVKHMQKLEQLGAPL